MKKEIKFSLVFRDMWQSAGKYLPRVDQLRRVAPEIVRMGCFSRVETNGGGFEQINLLFGENPNTSVREWTHTFNQNGIQTHMLDRALNGIRMSPVPADIRKLLFKVKKDQGVDIARSFCGLNDHRNIKNSIVFAKEAGMIAQAALSITFSEVHTVDYYLKLADKLVEYGADEICLKDMAGVGRPVFIGNIIAGIKKRHPKIVIQYHNHSGPGFASASILEAARAGVDYIDVGMEPLSWGTGHVDVITVQAMLKDAGFNVPEINMDAYMTVRAMLKEFIDDFLGYYINPKNRYMNSLLIGPGLPGGMMGSLMADLEKNLQSINKWFAKNNKPQITEDELLIKLFEEVQYVWPRVGYPPLVTPFSQYVKNLALMNIMQIMKGRERWSMIADNIWDMILGKTGTLPGKLAPEILQLAKEGNKEFYTGNPQDLYPDNLHVFKKEMEENGWSFGRLDEELLELAMHPEQYRAYKSGKAKSDFEADIQKRKEAVCTSKDKKSDEETRPSAPAPVDFKPKFMTVDVNGELFKVQVSYDEKAEEMQHPAPSEKPKAKANAKAHEILSPLEGKFFLTKSNNETPVKVGDKIKEGDLIGYVEAMKTYNAISSDFEGTVEEICFANSAEVDEDDVLIKIR
jgi:pyruvate carboxylase subunit B